MHGQNYKPRTNANDYLSRIAMDGLYFEKMAKSQKLSHLRIDIFSELKLFTVLTLMHCESKFGNFIKINVKLSMRFFVKKTL